MKRLMTAAILSMAAAALSAQPPTIHAPQNGYRAGDAGDTRCEDRPQCTVVDVEGWIPPDRVAVWVVAPEVIEAVFVQDTKPGDANGEVGATVNIGNVKDGAKQWFKIYLFACRADELPAAGETAFETLPASCEKSQPVRVYRVR